MDHEKSSRWLKFLIAFGSLGVITLDEVNNYGGMYVGGIEKESFRSMLPTFCLVMSKLEAFFMDTEFNVSQWKASSLLPAFSICFILILALIIFLSSPFNLLYMQKRGLKKDKARFKLTISFTTLYTISGTEFFIGGLIQGLIYLKGRYIFFNLKNI